MMLAIRDASSGEQFSLFQRGAGGSFEIGAAAQGAGFEISSVANLGTGVWHYAVGRFASDSSRILYLNGTAGAENTSTQTPSGLDTMAAGNDGAATPGLFFDGRLSRFAIWDVALSPSVCLALSNGLDPALIPTDRLNLCLMEGAALPEADEDAAGTWGSISGTPEQVADPPFYGFGSVTRKIVAIIGGEP
jgi:hypothetical protein